MNKILSFCKSSKKIIIISLGLILGIYYLSTGFISMDETRRDRERLAVEARDKLSEGVQIFVGGDVTAKANIWLSRHPEFKMITTSVTSKTGCTVLLIRWKRVEK